MTQPGQSPREPELVREQHGAVVVLRLNRPEARNALSLSLMRAVAAAVEAAEADAGVRALVVTGTGERAFCAGMDLRAFAEQGMGDEGVAPTYLRLVEGGARLPVVAAVNGVAVGGGCEIALAADLVVASSEASFGLPEVTRGLMAGVGVVHVARRLPLAIGLELTLTGGRMSAERAYEVGLVNHVVPPGEVLPRALALARAVAANAPLAVAASREIVRATAAGEPGVEDRLAEWQQRVFTSDDAREGARAFVEKRPPVWQGR